MTPEELELEKEKLALEREKVGIEHAKLGQQKSQSNFTIVKFIIGGVVITLLGLFINWDKIVRDDKARNRDLIIQQFEKIYAEPDPAARVEMLERLDRATEKHLKPIRDELVLSRAYLQRQQDADAAQRAEEEAARIAKSEEERIAADKRAAAIKAKQLAAKKAEEKRLAGAKKAVRGLIGRSIFR